MKRLLAYLFIVLGLGLTFGVSGNAASKIGKGDIQLDKRVVENFIKFLRNEYAVSFVVTPDGKYSTYGICGAERCKGGMVTVLKWCKRDTGQKCYVFAQRKKQKKIIRWDKADYVFPSEKWNYNEWAKNPTSDNLGIAKNISNQDVSNVLTDLDFIKSNKVENNSITKETIKVASVTKGDLDGFMNALEKAKNAGLTIDADTTAKQFGYKNFDEFFIHYKSEFEIGDISVEEAREVLLGADNTIDIVESQENLDKLHNLIINDKYFRKRTSYFKKKYNKKTKLLVVYMNYEKEMSKITKNPNLKKIGRFDFRFRSGNDKGKQFASVSGWEFNAMQDCEKSRKKYKLSGGECIIVETRYGDEYINLLKPRLTNKQKKKTLVTQKKIKIKKKSLDNEAPVIEIAEAITVDSQAYTLKGKVKDKSQIYLTINGRQVDVKKGKFELDRFSIDPDVAEELKIVAIDQWNNKSEKIVKVTIDLQSTDIAKVYEELKPNNVKVKTDKNKIAIIIGIEKYENLTNLDAKYANRDAKAFRTYATRALGIKPSNIKMLIDDKATRSQALKAFKLWLPKIAGKGGKDIHIFFAGHGLASDNGEDLYILPQDGESSLLEDTAISRVELISLINKVNPKSVTMFFDTCYSGQTRDERMLVASLRPIRIVADEQETPDNFTIFTASNYDQTSGSIEEAEHGMFSYYLMKGLEGKADENKDRKITNGELIAYLKENVSQEAFTQNRQQDPMLAGDPDKILIKF